MIQVLVIIVLEVIRTWGGRGMDFTFSFIDFEGYVRFICDGMRVAIDSSLPMKEKLAIVESFLSGRWGV